MATPGGLEPPTFSLEGFHRLLFSLKKLRSCRKCVASMVRWLRRSLHEGNGRRSTPLSARSWRSPATNLGASFVANLPHRLNPFV
jgi:hypothetical protein